MMKVKSLLIGFVTGAVVAGQLHYSLPQVLVEIYESAYKTVKMIY